MAEDDTAQRQTDQSASLEPQDIAESLALLSRLPLPVEGGKRGARAAWAYPLAGVVLGGIAAVVAALAGWLGLGSSVAALCALATLIITTGAMHEDGLADSADGLWGGWDRARRLEILKDSHIGAYGVLALVVSFALRWSALSALIAAGIGGWALIGAAALSRGAMPWIMATLPHARSDGLAHMVGAAPMRTAQIAAGVALGIGFICLGFKVLMVGCVVAALTLAASAIARAKIGGHTGDILGATQQVCEIGILLALVATL